MTTEAQHERPTANEALESLTGFEVIGIEDMYGGREFTELTGTRLTVGLVAMLLKREGMSSADAWQKARGMSLVQLNDQFAPEPEPTEPGEEQETGKADLGDVSTPPGPPSSLASAPGFLLGEFAALTLAQREALIRASQQASKER